MSGPQILTLITLALTWSGCTTDVPTEEPRDTIDVDVARDTAGEADLVDASPGEEVSQTCPPPEPLGLDVGDRWLNLAFEDCDGNPLELHDLCGSAALIFNFYGW